MLIDSRLIEVNKMLFFTEGKLHADPFGSLAFGLTRERLLLGAVLQKQSQRQQVSLGSSVVNRQRPGVRGGPGVSLAALQQPLRDLRVTEPGRQVEDGGTRTVFLL